MARLSSPKSALAGSSAAHHREAQPSYVVVITEDSQRRKDNRKFGFRSEQHANDFAAGVRKDGKAEVRPYKKGEKKVDRQYMAWPV